MARMIPSHMDDFTPPGERDVFNLLAAGPDDWCVVHSLDLSPWNHNLRTEIDFVTIVPDAGILCIEVKSHPNITFDGSVWSPTEIKRSPFKQAADGRHTFYRRMRELAPEFRRIPVVHLCAFANAIFDLKPNLSVQSWELMDTRVFRMFSNSTDFCDNLKQRILSSIDADARLKRLEASLTVSEIQKIVNLCVPVQKFRPEAREEIRRREEEIERLLREQQKPVLQLAMLNDRVLVSGGAGTGKTLIAMELARRMAERRQRVALFCFNQLVGEWLKETMLQFKPVLPNMVTGRAIQIMAEMTGIGIPENPDREFWEHVLPTSIEEKLTDPELRAIAPFDYLVLDEAQDFFIRPGLWACLVQFINGGLERGRYTLLGDFEHQVLGERELLNQTLGTLSSMIRPAYWRLSENCRNYKIIGETAVRLSGFDRQIYSGYMRKGGSIQNYDVYFYSKIDDQTGKRADYLNEFKQQGYLPEEITILSFGSIDSCAASSLKKRGYRLCPAWQHDHCVRFCTIHAYKGLENKVIILTDVNPTSADFNRDLFYIGMTRATESIRVLCDTRSQAILIEWLTKGGAMHEWQI